MSRPLRSAPITGASALLPAGPPARAATVLSTSPFQRLGALPRAPATRAQYRRAPSRVSARKPQTGLAPPARRAPPGQQYGLPPGSSRDGHYRPGSDAVSSSRRFSGGSLAFAFPVPA